MDMNFTYTQLASAAAIAVLVSSLVYKRFNAGSHLPPGPKPLPLIGNLLEFPKNEPWLTYEKWGKHYNSDVLHLNVLGTDMIIVNSNKAATALFERKSGLYSDRPRMTMINELIGLFWHFGFMPQGEAWRKTRKIFSDGLNPTATARFRVQMGKWNKIFLRNISATPEHLFQHLQHMASGIALEAAFGMQVQPSGQPDPFIGAAKQAVEAMIHAGLYGSYIVDFLPFLKYVPTAFANFKKQAKHWRVSVDIAGTVPFDLAKAALAENKAEPSVTSSLISKNDASDEVNIAQATHAIFASGSAATVSALGTFFLAMMQYPDVQRKAQAELDQVLAGKNRLPDFSDEAALPYVSAIIKETLRWNPIVPLAFPHKLTADDTYEGYHLPAGSVVIPNAWAMLHEEEVYGKDTYDFKPERFLGSTKFPDVAFGFARRRCPGKHFAQASLFITISTTLACFDISKPVDANGELIEPSGKYTNGMLRYPLPFECRITPRSEAHKLLIEV